MSNLGVSMSHRTSGRWRLGLFLSLVTVLLWGVLPLALSVALQALDVYTLTWFRFLTAFTLLFGYLASQKQLPPLTKLNLSNWLLLIVATVFLAANYLLYLEGLRQTSPANAQVLIQLAPVLLGLGAVLIFKERYTTQQWVGLAILSLGFALFFNEQLQSLAGAAPQYLAGSGLVIVSSATWAFYALAQKQLLRVLSSAGVMLVIYGGSALLFTPMAMPARLLSIDPFHAGVLLFCALNTLVAYGAFAEALEHWEASRVSAVLALTPMVTLLSVFIASFLTTSFAGAPLSLLGLAGAGFVVLGSLLMALGRRV